jgi:hypothetical protein
MSLINFPRKLAPLVFGLAIPAAAAMDGGASADAAGVHSGVQREALVAYVECMQAALRPAAAAGRAPARCLAERGAYRVTLSEELADSVVSDVDDAIARRGRQQGE